MSNFSYLSTRPEYSLFANSAIEAEKVFSTSPAMCAVGCRKALELAVKWVYAADKTITMPYKDNLQSLLHEPSFRFAVDRNVWSVLPSIVKAGNLAVHTGHSVSAADAVFSLRGLFDFIQWVDYCYGTDYVERSFDETAIPGEKVALDEKRIHITGSNSKMLSSEIASTLGGRFMIVDIYPYSFPEYLAAQGKDKNYLEVLSTKDRAEVVGMCDQYVKYGAFPELVDIRNKREYLNSIYQTIYLGDIITRNKITNDFAVRLILKKIAESVTKPLSFNRLSNILKSAGAVLGKQTVIN